MTDAKSASPEPQHTPARKPKHEAWVMPSWMEPYRAFITNTGGNPIEELMNDHKTTTDVNVVRALLCVAVKSQVGMLMRAYQNGALPMVLLAERDALKATVATQEREIESAMRQSDLSREGDAERRGLIRDLTTVLERRNAEVAALRERNAKLAAALKGLCETPPGSASPLGTHDHGRYYGASCNAWEVAHAALAEHEKGGAA